MGLGEYGHVFWSIVPGKMSGRCIGLSPAVLAMALLISLQLCSCFVLREKPYYKPDYQVNKVKPVNKKRLKDDHFGYDILEPLDVVEMKPVSIYQFERELNIAQNYRDVLRIFYGKHLSDSVVDEILQAEVPYEKHKGHHREHGFSSDRSKDLGEDANAALRHMDEMRKSKLTECKPRPMVIHMQDKLSMGAKIFFWPTCTVVYRCDQDSGCCGHDTTITKVCLPKTVERVAKSFFVAERIMGTDKVKPRFADTIADTLVFENHTSCECQSKSTHLKNKCSECPFPYTLTKGAPDCICDCDPGSIVCMEIKVGNRSFDEKPLQCIKEELCQTPLCEYGNFDMRSVRSGYCPAKKKELPFPDHGFQPPEVVLIREKETDSSYFDSVESGSGFDDDMEDDEYGEETNFLDYSHGP